MHLFVVKALYINLVFINKQVVKHVCRLNIIAIADSFPTLFKFICVPFVSDLHLHWW